MAGRKRKTYQEQTQQPQKQVLEPVLEWPTAIYARLSVENSGKDDGGDSIENQVEICRGYLEDHPYLHLYDVYMDNGWTGTNTNRPEFQRMLDDIHSGKVKAIIIKDFSRFSRDYIEAGNLLENVFPFLGVRFISVADSYDSFETDGSAQSLLIPLKNLINSYYSKDISRKVSTAVHSQQLAGKHLPSQIPYGYMKSEARAYRLEPDPETAPVVRRIFKEFYDGAGISQIARELNDEGVPSPGQIRYNRGLTVRPCYKTSRWSPQVIKQILRNPTYTGDLVFGRMPTALYLGKPNYSYEFDETKWRVLPDMHEPLVSREVFNAIKERMTASQKQYQARHKAFEEFREENPAILLDFVYCGDCGARMSFTRQHISGSDAAHAYYKCPRYPYKRCNATHNISQDRLISIVWNALQDQLRYFCDFQMLTQKMKESGTETAQQVSYKDEIKSVLMKIHQYMGKRERLYEDFSDGILSPEDYTSFKKRYEDEYQALNKQLNHLQTLQSRLNRSLSERNEWLVHMQTVQDATEFNRDLLVAMVDKILVYQVGRERRVEVVFKYRQDFSVLQAAYEEMEGDTRK